MRQTTAVTGCVFSHHLPSVGPLLHGLLPGDDWRRVKVVSWLAARYGLTSNVAYFARTNPGVLYAAAQAQRKALEAGEVESGVLYVLTAPGLVERACGTPGVNCIAIEGTTLALKKERR